MSNFNHLSTDEGNILFYAENKSRILHVSCIIVLYNTALIHKLVLPV